MEKYFETIQKCVLFNAITENDLRTMLPCLNTRLKTYVKNQMIFSVGEITSDLGFVLSGSVLIFKDDYWGNRSIISKFSSESFFAEAFAADGKPLQINAMATEKTAILFIDFNKMTMMCAKSCSFHMQLIQNFIHLLSKKNILLTQKIDILVKRTTREKIMSYLSEYADGCGSNAFDIPYNRQQLADFLSVDRSAMSSCLAKLRDEGFLTFNRNHFVLHE